MSLANALALSNPTLKALDYNVDATAARATMLEDADFARLGVRVKELPAMQRQADEVVAARTGVASRSPSAWRACSAGSPHEHAARVLVPLRDHVRGAVHPHDHRHRNAIGRFLMQEFMGRLSPSLGKSTSKPGAVIATTVIVAGWTYFILTGSISTIWPMFGIANQLLACTALCIGTTIILREGRRSPTRSSRCARCSS